MKNREIKLLRAEILQLRPPPARAPEPPSSCVLQLCLRGCFQQQWLGFSPTLEELTAEIGSLKSPSRRCPWPAGGEQGNTKRIRRNASVLSRSWNRGQQINKIIPLCGFYSFLPSTNSFLQGHLLSHQNHQLQTSHLPCLWASRPYLRLGPPKHSFSALSTH